MLSKMSIDLGSLMMGRILSKQYITGLLGSRGVLLTFNLIIIRDFFSQKVVTAKEFFIRIFAFRKAQNPLRKKYHFLQAYSLL